MSWSLRPTGRTLGTAEKKMTRRMLNLLEQKSNKSDKRCSSKKICSDFSKLRQLMLVEEFKRCINSDVKSFLDVKKLKL